MRKGIMVLMSVVVVAGAGFFSWNYFVKPAEPLPEIHTIVAFGDSLIEGYGATDGNDMVSVLSRKIARPIINEGKSGETSAQGLARINSILAHDPDMVILLFGGNDVLQRVPLETTFENLRSIILTLQAHDITVVLLGVQGGALTDPFRKPFDELAKTYNLIYIPNVLHKVFTKEELMSDAVHPNDAGYAIIANRVFEAIQHLFN